MTDPHVPYALGTAFTRRRFLQASAVAAAAASLPLPMRPALAGGDGCDPFDTRGA